MGSSCCRAGAVVTSSICSGLSGGVLWPWAPQHFARATEVTGEHWAQLEPLDFCLQFGVRDGEWAVGSVKPPSNPQFCCLQPLFFSASVLIPSCKKDGHSPLGRRTVMVQDKCVVNRRYYCLITRSDSHWVDFLVHFPPPNPWSLHLLSPIPRPPPNMGTGPRRWGTCRGSVMLHTGRGSCSFPPRVSPRGHSAG